MVGLVSKADTAPPSADVRACSRGWFAPCWCHTTRLGAPGFGRLLTMRSCTIEKRVSWYSGLPRASPSSPAPWGVTAAVTERAGEDPRRIGLCISVMPTLVPLPDSCSPGGDATRQRDELGMDVRMLCVLLVPKRCLEDSGEPVAGAGYRGKGVKRGGWGS